MSPNNFIPFLSNKRVSLKPIISEDISMLMKWFNDPLIRKYLKPRMPRLPQRFKNMIESQEQTRYPSDINFIIYENESMKPIGICGLLSIWWEYKQAELYISIGEKDYWGQGLAVVANTLLLDYAFSELNFHKIYVMIFEKNIQSIKAAIKTGFQKEAILKDQVFLDFEYQDLIFLSIFQENFIKMRNMPSKS